MKPVACQLWSNHRTWDGDIVTMQLRFDTNAITRLREATEVEERLSALEDRLGRRMPSRGALRGPEHSGAGPKINVQFYRN
jgi:hypothetical protein